ncbi:glycosyl transferase [Halteromyces radiatus]|uniref:glycosyl transferase n=1 Tax=Halteromyces radiatus TaxID=101107 RepID=UPI0022211F00|nr:glycosyl transferase [Halteromyces radiatus]KAI8080029.1 glycosyl transferase [Halteromyces radiatus]
MLSLLILSTLVKCLLFPAYRSTDFEVHRNWLAITYSLPISQWYLEATSEWTLDYPPFFAWFEKILSLVAYQVDPLMVHISQYGYNSDATVIYQRLTVIVSELVLYWALLRYINTSTPVVSKTTKVSSLVVIAASIFLHPGLWIVDHLHFQYNGLLYGILLHSIVEAKKNRLLSSGILFAILLNFKHIYLYLSPAYFVYLLQAYCYTNNRSFSVTRFFRLGGSVLAVFGLSLFPFIKTGQLNAMITRLFPFTRGLCHAYWAPNVWALYAGLDRCLILVAKKCHWSFDESAVTSMTRGYVGDTVFAILPPVKTIHTMILTVLVQLMVLQVLWRKPTYDHFISSLTLCGFASYLFGWHVHEKAIMLILIPYSLMALKSTFHLRQFVILSSAGIMSLYPLLFHIQETPLKLLITVIWYLSVLPGLCYCLDMRLKQLLTKLEGIYVMGLILVQCYTGLGHSLLFGTSYEFLPLMMTSVYCAIGIVYSWIVLMYDHLVS